MEAGDIRMSSVDDRIVNMQFNNKQFTQGATESIRALDGVDRALANAGKGKGLSTMASGVSQVSTKFSAMQVAGVAALSTIVAKATSAGLSLVKKLTIQPLIDGFKEYQTNLQSIQTIKSNTGESLKRVEGALQNLNDYSDKTIYNFSEMAKNIGTFTAAGVKLDVATDAIKGIANLAAFSGSTSQQASTAMYQLSQAIAAGRVSLQDWNSVVNAGMGGKTFQTALARTAQNMGDLTEGAAKLNKETGQLTINGQSFRQSISATGGGSSWLNGVALTETLKQISGAYSEAELRAKGYTESQIDDIIKLANTAFDAATKIKTFPQLFQVVQESIGSMFAKSFSLIVGNFAQSKNLWGAIGASIVGPFGILTKISNGVTKSLETWVDEGGRNRVLAGFRTIFQNIGRFLVPLKHAFSDIFPDDGENDLLKISQAFRDFTQNLRLHVDTMHNLRSIFGGVFAVLHIGFEVVKGIASAFGNFFGVIFKSSDGAKDGILGVFAGLGDALMALDKFLTQGGKLSEFLGGLGKVAGQFLAPFISGLGGITNVVGSVFSSLFDKVDFSQFDMSGIFDSLKNSVNGLDFSGIFDGFKDDLASVGGTLFGFLADITSPFEGVSNFFSDLQDKMATIADAVSSVAGPIDNVAGSVSGLSGSGSSALDFVIGKFNQLKGSLSGLSDVGGTVLDFIVRNFDKLKDATEGTRASLAGLFDVFSGVAVNVASDQTDSIRQGAENTAKVFDFLKNVLAGVGPALMAVFRGIGKAGEIVKNVFSQLFGNYDAIEWASVVNALFSGALILTLKRFFDGMSGWVGLGGSIKDTFNQLQDSLKDLTSGAIKAALIRSIAIAVGILVASMFVLSKLDTEALAKGIGSIALLMGILVATMTAMNNIGKTVGKDGEVLNTFNANLILLATSMVLMANAMVQMAIAVKIFGSMDLDEMAKGFGGLALAMGIMVGAVRIMNGIKGQILGAAAAIAVMAASMLVVAAAVKIFGNMSLETLAKGLGAMAISMAIMVGALRLLTDKSLGTGLVEAGAALALVAAAMLIMSLAVARLGEMDLGSLAKGVGFMALSLGIMVAALLILANAGPGVLFAAGAMVLMASALQTLTGIILVLGLAPWQTVAAGIGFFALALGVLLAAGAIAGIPIVTVGLLALGVTVGLLGVAMLAAGAGMLAFGTGFAIMAAAGVAGVAILVLAFKAFIALLPSIAVQLAAAFVAFLKTMASASGQIRASLGEIFRNMIGVIRDAIPEVRDLFLDLIQAALAVIDGSVDQFVSTGFHILMAFLRGIDDNISEIGNRAASIIVKFIGVLGDNAGKLADAGLQMLIDTMNGIADAVRSNAEAITNAAINVADAFVDALRTAFTTLMGSIDWKGIISGFLPSGSDVLGMIKDIPGVPGGGDDRNSRAGEEGGGSRNEPANPLKAAMKAAQAAVSQTLSFLGTDIDVSSPSVAAAAKRAQLAQRTATSSQTTASVLGDTATKKEARLKALEREQRQAERKAAKDKKDKEKKEAAKAAKEAAEAAAEAAKKARNKATRAQTRADRKQTRADEAFQKVRDAQAFVDADNTGKGDIKAQQAADLAAKAQEKLEQARQLRELANKEKNGKKAEELRRRAQKLAEQSKQLADDAETANNEAQAFYEAARLAELAAAAAAVRDRIQALQDEIAERARLAAEEAELEAATDEEKVNILTRRAEANEARAAAEAASVQSLLAQANALADTDAVAAAALVDQAEVAAQNAQEAADLAEQQREQAQQLTEQLAQANASGGTTGDGSGSSILPSRTALEDAAREVDRYTQSLAAAEAAAGSASPTVQYVQNNYSPTALSDAEIYRRTNNLLNNTITSGGPVYTPVS
jgi:tape measure domain-containing protein